MTSQQIPAELQEKYFALNERNPAKASEDKIDTDALLVLDYDHPDVLIDVQSDAEEFAAACPASGLPDYGTVTVKYTPKDRLLELKSLKYYLLSFIGVGIAQEHVAARIYSDIRNVLDPYDLVVVVDYKSRGGIHTVVTAPVSGDGEL